MANRVALVTGGASGIGKAICLSMSREKAKVVVADINEPAMRTTAREVAAEGGQVLALSLDITRAKDIAGAVRQATEHFGPIDILVNNAGWDRAMPFVETNEDLWDRILALNLKGHIVVTRAVLDGMIARQYGKIINISSDAGRVGSSGEVVYSAAKAGMIGFTKALAREMARYNICVNCICPGPTDTPLFAEIARDTPRLAEALIRATPMRRLARVQDIAAAAVFFASHDSDYITGQTLSISGGLTMV
ncbi:MAG: 3-oxoacyl-ACP reductase FabG [Chloroflexi bacterium]|nr:3-oxoacyl-ACP reductase FabG [Chloroflexota bacterium]